ncbi:hypothetical protein D3C85_1810550 [compost metagenome]
MKESYKLENKTAGRLIELEHEKLVLLEEISDLKDELEVKKNDLARCNSMIKKIEREVLE